LTSNPGTRVSMMVPITALNRHRPVTESVALPPPNCGEARCSVAIPNLSKIASHLSLGRSEREPLSFHRVKRKMTCSGKAG
jgi:hypothetical protein